MKRYFSKMTLALIVALVMSLAIAIPAMADPLPAEGDPLEVGITKELNMPPGTTIPESVFQFTMTQVVPVADSAPATFNTTIPAGSSVTFTHAAGSNDPANPGDLEIWFPSGTGNLGTTGDILDGITWPHAGDFYFVIREVPNTNTAPSVTALAPNEHMVYSDQVFVLQVRVANVDGNLIPRLGFAYVGSPGTPGEPGTPDTWHQVGPKLNELRPGTPGTPGEPGTDPILDDPSQIRFINDFTRDSLDDDDWALGIQKMITGEFANMELDFSFDASLTIPTLALTRTVPFTGPITATVVNATTGDPVIPARTVTFTGTTTGTGPGETPALVLSATFDLGHNERLHIPGLPAGTVFGVLETQIPEYAATAVVTRGGVAVETVTGAVGANVGTTPTYIDDSGMNRAAFTNDHNAPPFTGLVIGSMPFLTLLLGATLILAMMMAARSRQRIEQLPVAH